MSRRKTSRISVLLSAATLAVVTAGCGGGGGSSSGQSSTPPAGQTMTFGGLTANVAGTLQAPVTAAGSGAVVTGVAGANITSLALAQAPNLSNTLIAFSRNGNTLAVRPDGSGQYNLTTAIPTYSNATSPSWGPGGKDFVIQRYDATIGRFQIYNALADGSNLKKISTGNFSDYTPSYAATGARVAFSRVDSSGLSQIYTVPPTGGAATKISDGAGNDSNPAWSANGTQIVFTRYINSHSQLYIMSSTGASPHALTSNYTSYDMYYPAWSPDGTKIAFTLYLGSYYNIYVISADGSTLQQLSSGNAYDYYPTWSPDGKRIAFSHSATSSAASAIYTMSAIDGSSPTQITYPSGGSGDSTPSWSSYIASRPLIGATGSMGVSAGGFIFSQQGTAVPSIVTFDSGTRTGLTVTSQTGINPGLPNVVFLVSATANLTSLAYKNNLNSTTTTVIGTGGISGTTASNALVSFDASTGLVSSVLPYIAAHAVANAKTGLLKPSVQGNVLVYQGHFLGAWNGSGKNIAPSGGSEARINAQTGALISIN